MVAPINSLMNMEFMLYGGASGANAACPSYANGYMANRNSWNMPFYGYNGNMGQYGNNNSAFNGGMNINRSALSDSIANAASKSSSKDLDVLGEYYLKGLSPSESIMGAAVGGAAFEIINNLRFITNPWNSFTTIGKVDKMFRAPELKELWGNKESFELMKDAYARMHKLEVGGMSRPGLFKKRLDKSVYDSLKSEMEAALNSGNKEAIATATERIRIATNANTGYLAQGWAKLKGALGFNGTITPVAERIADSGKISQAVTKNMTERYASKTLGQHLIHDFKGQAGLGGLLFAAMEFVFDWGKLKAAFSKDSETGWKQVGQTSIKAAGSIIGWSAGSAVGTWAGAKLGAMAGTAIAPGVGTVIGAIAGAVGGMIGCNLMGRVTHKIIGEDVGSKVELAQMKATPQGQAQLLQITLAQAQSDKKLDPKVAAALQNVAAQYS